MSPTPNSMSSGKSSRLVRDPLSWQHDGMAAGPQAPAAQRGARTAPTRPQGQGILLQGAEGRKRRLKSSGNAGRIS
eukprot:1185512-Prorocentrum_minimum.AAC.3